MKEDVPGETLQEDAEVMEIKLPSWGRQRVGTHQASILLPFQVASTQHVLGDSFLTGSGSPPVQAFAEFGVDDGHLQLLKGLRVGQGHWEQRRESGPV